MRKIIHIDMDAFFASTEQRDNPELRGRPIAVGFDDPHGVVSTVSYETRPFGVYSAMSVAQVKRCCPQLIAVSSHFDRHKEVLRQIHVVFREYTDLVEPILLDEAFLDISESKKGVDLTVDIAKEIRQKILERISLTAFAGISHNKLLVKIASDMRKPNRIFTAHPNRVLDFIDKLPAEKLWDVGPKTAGRVHDTGVFTGEWLREISREHLMQVFGKMSNAYYNSSCGIDDCPVVVSYERRSVGCECTLLEDLHIESKVIIELYHVTLELVERIKAKDFKGRTLIPKLKWDATTQITRSLTQDKILRTKDNILPLAKQLLKDTDYHNRPIRLVGLSASSPKTNEKEGQIRPQWTEGSLLLEKDNFAT